MTTYATGRTGALKLAGTEVLKVRDWALNATAEALETTTLNDAAPKYRFGKNSFSGSCTAYYYINDYYNTKTLEAAGLLTSTLTASQVSTNTKFAMELVIDAGKSFSFDALITSAAVSNSAGGLAVLSLSFVVDGFLSTVSGAS
jgi:hypothetical protein